MTNASRAVRSVLAGLIAAAVAACSTISEAPVEPSQELAEPAQLYAGGPILTMEGEVPTYVEALVVQDGKIAFVGTLNEATVRFPKHTAEDLGGKTLLPGFIDGHGHLYITGLFSLMANLYPAPDGPGESHDALIRSLQAWSDTDDGKLVAEKFGWIVGVGYDDSRLVEGKHPTAEELDRVSTELPVMVVHQSTHLASINSKAIEVLGFTSETPDPDGGVIRRNPDGSPSGVLEESAFLQAAGRAFAKTDAAMQAAAVSEGQQQYARWGYTTAQDGRSSPAENAAFVAAASDGKLFLDVVAYPDMQFGISVMENGYYNPAAIYRDHYRIGGVKLSLDGSPQGKTAWLTEPYFRPPHGQDPDYVGYPAMPAEQAKALVGKAFENDWQILVHANGDAAIDLLIEAVAEAGVAHSRPDHRTVLIHGQTLRKDQIGGLAGNDILPSLFPMHTFYWGDWHRDSVLGTERAQYISPTRDVLNAGLTLTSHHDAPVTYPNSMRVLDATVNRTTRTNDVLGPDQRLTPYEGLKALTIWAARQYFEEDRKGTLTEGKLADLVILDQNPLTVDPEFIDSIRVVATYKEGHLVWAASKPSR